MLVDGLMRATWAARRDGDTTVLPSGRRCPCRPPTGPTSSREGGRLLEFLAPGRIHDVRFLDS